MPVREVFELTRETDEHTAIDPPPLRGEVAFENVRFGYGSATPVLEFLVESYAVVPTGSELDRVDLDAEIAALLG